MPPLLFAIFSPQSKMSRIALIFYLLQQNWEICNIYKAEGGNWGAKHHTRLTAEQEIWNSKTESAILFWGWLQTWPSHCYKLRASPGKGNSSHVTDPHLLPCHRALGTLASLGLLTDSNTAQAQGALLVHPFHRCPKWGYLYLWLDNDRNHQHFACCGK